MVLALPILYPVLLMLLWVVLLWSCASWTHQLACVLAEFLSISKPLWSHNLQKPAEGSTVMPARISPGLQWTRQLRRPSSCLTTALG